MNEHEELCLLLNACGLTNRELHRLAARESPPMRLLREPTRASEDGLRAAVGTRLARLLDEQFVARERERALQLGVDLQAFPSERYPRCLREIYDPPLVLYHRGMAIPEAAAVAVVGARRCTPYGRDQARKLGRRLAQHAVPVSSGLALGIDQWAHRGCLDADGLPIAVLGCGIDQVYPPGSEAMHGELVRRGVLLSEFPIGTPPSKLSFPRRNRLVSGLAQVVVVIEATTRSGSLITADFAQQQGRAVFALPGPVDRAESRGTNELIRDGATPLLDPEDVLTALGFKAKPEPATAARATLQGTQKIVAARLALGEASVSELIAETELHYEEVVAALFELEADGRVERCAGEIYRWLTNT